MTMLDRMRRHRGWLKWTMGIVAVAMAAFLRPWHNRAVQLDESVADVEGTAITAGEFRRELNQRLQMFQAQGGGSLPPETLKQLGFDNQVLTAAHRSQGDRSRSEAARACASPTPRWSSSSSTSPPSARTASSSARTAIAPCCARSGRRCGRTTSRRAIRADLLVAEAPGGGHQLGHRLRAGGGRRVPPPQREGEARRRRLHGRPVPHRRSPPPTPRRRRTTRRIRRATSSASAARSAT